MHLFVHEFFATRNVVTAAFVVATDEKLRKEETLLVNCQRTQGDRNGN